MARTKLQPLGRHESKSLRELKLTCMSNLLTTTNERVYFKDLQSRFLFVSAGWIAACAPGSTAEELSLIHISGTPCVLSTSRCSDPASWCGQNPASRAA